MRSGLFFLSVGLLAVRAGPLRTSGQKATGGVPSLPAAHGFPPPVQKLASEGAVTLTSELEGLYNETTIIWLRNDEVVVSAFVSTRNPSEENRTSFYTTVSTYLETWLLGDSYTSLIELKAPPPLTVQKITRKGTGDPSASDKTIFRPRFQQDEMASISCIVDGPLPPNSSITWQKNGSPLPADIHAVRNGSEDGFSMYSTLILPEDEDPSGNYSCTIGQEGLEIQPPTTTLEDRGENAG